MSEDYMVRKCHVCGDIMWDGYCIGDGLEYYCSEKCLYSVYTKSEWYNDIYGNDNGYYTEWYDEEEEYEKAKAKEI